FIGNHSSGKMGFALAESLAEAGAKVILISGPVNLSPIHPAIELQKVITADEMYEACIRNFPECNGAILSAAVADYKPL
ncbi:phosphopantothenoylcysteine decarboxylase, partial [Acinetobacter baumannii]